jgi:hypothetical protein
MHYRLSALRLLEDNDSSTCPRARARARAGVSECGKLEIDTLALPSARSRPAMHSPRLHSSILADRRSADALSCRRSLSSFIRGRQIADPLEILSSDRATKRVSLSLW